MIDNVLYQSLIENRKPTTNPLARPRGSIPYGAGSQKEYASEAATRTQTIAKNHSSDARQ